MSILGLGDGNKERSKNQLILTELERVKLGKNEIPSLLLGDSQAVKNTADIETKGFL